MSERGMDPHLHLPHHVLPRALRGGGAGVGDEGVTDGEKTFMYFMAFTGFLCILWLKRDAMNGGRKRVVAGVRRAGAHLRELDRAVPVDEDNFRIIAASTGIGASY